MGSGWGSVGRLVTSNSKIELRQRETHLLLTIEKTKIKHLKIEHCMNLELPRCYM